MFLNLTQVDDFLESTRHQWEVNRWEDISLPLQEYYFASRLFSKAKPEEMNGDLLEWKLQIAFNDTYALAGLYQDDKTKRGDMMTHARCGWSMSTVNYTYDIKENVFNQAPERIINYMVALEHGMYESYFTHKELEMFGVGPTAQNQTTPAPFSLLWWIQVYSATSGSFGTPGGGNGQNTGSYALPAGTTSGFFGMDPYGFTGVGAGQIPSASYPGWRNRNGTYVSFSEDDAINTIIECIDKCSFKSPHSYPALVQGRPRQELLTTYSVVKKARNLLQAGNDDIRSSVDRWKIDAPMLRDRPLVWVPAWSNQEFGLTRTDGVILGVDWSTMHWFSKSGMRMQKQPPRMDKDKHTVRWIDMDDSGQLVCYDRRRNFAVNSTVSVTESD